MQSPPPVRSPLVERPGVVPPVPPPQVEVGHRLVRMALADGLLQGVLVEAHGVGLEAAPVGATNELGVLGGLDHVIENRQSPSCTTCACGMSMSRNGVAGAMDDNERRCASTSGPPPGIGNFGMPGSSNLSRESSSGSACVQGEAGLS